MSWLAVSEAGLSGAAEAGADTARPPATRAMSDAQFRIFITVLQRKGTMENTIVQPQPIIMVNKVNRPNQGNRVNKRLTML
jgi:hypothetical protein